MSLRLPVRARTQTGAKRSNLFDSATADTPRNDLGITCYEFFNQQSTIDNQQSCKGEIQ